MSNASTDRDQTTNYKNPLASAGEAPQKVANSKLTKNNAILLYCFGKTKERIKYVQNVLFSVSETS